MLNFAMPRQLCFLDLFGFPFLKHNPVLLNIYRRDDLFFLQEQNCLTRYKPPSELRQSCYKQA